MNTNEVLNKLKAEIERQIKSIENATGDFAEGRRWELENLCNLVTSLQQERPEPSCKSCGFYENNCPFIRGKFIPYPNKVCKDYTYSVMKE